MADHRFPERVLPVNGAEHQLAQGAARIILPHVDFPADHVLFLVELGMGKGGPGGQVCEYVQGGVESFAEGINPIYRAVEGGVGIQVSAAVLDGFGQFTGAALAGPLKHHVLHEMGDARAP